MSLLFDAQTLSGHGLVIELLSNTGSFLRWFIASAAVFALCFTSNFRSRFSVFLSGRSSGYVFATFCIHLSLFLVFIYLSLLLFGKIQKSTTFLGYMWILVAGAVGLSLALIVADVRSWRKFIVAEKKSIAFAAAGGLFIFFLSAISKQFWGTMTEFTLGSTKLLLQVFYNDIIFDPSESKLGIETFWVTIAPSCSGIEGMVLACATAAIYLFLARDYLCFPRAFVLMPLAAIISIALNLVRIAALIVVGAELSPEIAVGGFHSVAGWIASVVVALLIVFFFSNWHWIQKPVTGVQAPHATPSDTGIALAILVPFVVFAGISLISGIFGTQFDYLYPLKAILGFALILYFWNQYQFEVPDTIFESIAAGCLVAILWIALAPVNLEENAVFAQSLSNMSLWALIGWCAFRIAGFWILAPIIEELVFRGYLLSRLSGQEISNNRRLGFSLLAMITSSILFGFLHNAWLAGTVSGMLFALVRYRSSSITSPILAHSTANIMLTVWAVNTGNWSTI